MGHVIGGEYVGIPPFVRDDLGTSWERFPEDEIEMVWKPTHEDVVELRNRIGENINTADLIESLTRTGQTEELPEVGNGEVPLSRVDFAFLTYTSLRAEKAAAWEEATEPERAQAEAHANLEAVGREINRLTLAKFESNVGFKAMPPEDAWPKAHSDATIQVVSYLMTEERKAK